MKALDFIHSKSKASYFPLKLILSLFILSSFSSAQAPIEINVTNSGSTYIIDSQTNPALLLEKGLTYIFHVNAPGHPFWIKTVQSTGTGNAYNTGVTGNGTANGDVTFVVPNNVPDELFYNCEIHPSMTNSISFKDAENQLPAAFSWINPPRDTIYINDSNLTTIHKIEWTSSLDGDGDSIKYHVKLIEPAAEIIEIVSDTFLVFEYQEFINHWPTGNNSTAVDFKFEVWANDGFDSTKISGDPLEIFVDKSQYLAIISAGIPAEYNLYQNYPNPFNPITTFKYNLPEAADISIVIYNLLGQSIKTFNFHNVPAGHHAVTWSGENDFGRRVGAGVYLFQLKTLNYTNTRKMLLLK